MSIREEKFHKQEEVLNYIKQGKMKEAEIICKKILDQGSKNYQVYFYMSITCGLERVDEMIHWLEKTIELNPKFSSAYNNLGIAYKTKGQFDLAIEVYKKAKE